MLESINIHNILFLDIETVSQHGNYEKLDEPMKELWNKKAATFRRDIALETPSDLYSRAGIYAEFGKIICISVGYIRNDNKQNTLRVKSFYGNDEKKILTDFIDLLNAYYNRTESLLCAHNGKEFDFPYIARRILINGLKIPYLLDLSGKKPWEVGLLDTMDLWRFGDYKNYTSLNLLSAVFNIPTSKDDIDGSMVNSVYWEEKNLGRIVSYCQKDVITIAQVLLRFKLEPLLEECNIYISETSME